MLSELLSQNRFALGHAYDFFFLPSIPPDCWVNYADLTMLEGESKCFFGFFSINL